jgi:predicted O-methyltransferase YrrM
MFEAAKKYFGVNPVVGVEVGVSAGVNVVEVLDEWKEVQKLYCIDYYPTYSDFKTQEEQTRLLNCVVSNIAGESKAHLIIEQSTVAARDFLDGYLDFVYIDANHSYTFVKEDILAWLPKIKKCGVIGGHDLDWADAEYGNELSVHKAVREIFGDRALCDKSLFTPNSRTRENGYYTGRDSDWWVFL